MRRNTLVLGFVILAILLAGCASTVDTVQPGGQQQDTAETVTIGFMGPLSGDAALYGESIRRGVELAQQEIDAPIEIIYEDSKCTGKDAVSAINKLITADNVQAIIGEACSGATLAAAPIAEQNQVVLISGASTSPDITDAGDYIFRTIPSDALQGRFSADLVYGDGHRTLAVLYTNEEYGLGFQRVLTERFAELGGEVVAVETMERGSVDARTQLTKIRDADPDALFVIANSPDSGVAALQQAQELGIGAALYGPEAFNTEEILNSAGEAMEGMKIVSVSTGTSAFKERHEQAHGQGPGPFAAQGYDAYQALAMAVNQGATTGREIKDTLYDVLFEGASGSISFDGNGDVSGNYDVYVAQDGAFVPE